MSKPIQPKKLRPYGDDIRSGSADSVLASLYRSILDSLMGQAAFSNRLTAYVMKTYRHASNLKDRASIRSQTLKELMSDKMTFKVFMKGLQVINVRRFDLIIRLHHENGLITEHQKSVAIDMESNNEADSGKTGSID